jgi:hypothetical protein
LKAHGGTMTKATSSVSGCTESPTCDGEDQLRRIPPCALQHGMQASMAIMGRGKGLP